MNEDNFLDKDSNASFNSRSISGLSATFSFPTVYLDIWTKECVEDYSSKIAK